MADDFGRLLGQAYLRLSAALFVSVFGPPEQRELVGRLYDGKLPEDEARAVREGLDRVAGKITGGSSQAQAITCTRCGRTSYNPNDVREGYCGYCHDWTSSGSAAAGHNAP